jgi:NAD(P)-dependent dehydrogenase (short-subunit alcohol dehydrogenase family)
MDDAQDRLKGKTALITGAAKRLGRAMALALARRGVNVVVHYHRSDRAAADVCDEVDRLGASAWRVQADLSDAHQAQRVFEEAESKAGFIDILVNSASRFDKDTLWSAGDESLSRNLRLHTAAPLILARGMAQQDRPGHIVNLLDTRVMVYDREHVSYHISKRMLLTLTQMLALELAPRIAVNAIAPGLILPPEGEDQSYLERLAHANPLHRCGDPADVTDALLFLVSSRFVTGQVVYVDGGYHMKGHLYD